MGGGEIFLTRSICQKKRKWTKSTNFTKNVNQNVPIWTLHFKNVFTWGGTPLRLTGKNISEADFWENKQANEKVKEKQLYPKLISSRLSFDINVFSFFLELYRSHDNPLTIFAEWQAVGSMEKLWKVLLNIWLMNMECPLHITKSFHLLVYSSNILLPKPTSVGWSIGNQKSALFLAASTSNRCTCQI